MTIVVADFAAREAWRGWTAFLPGPAPGLPEQLRGLGRIFLEKRLDVPVLFVRVAIVLA